MSHNHQPKSWLHILKGAVVTSLVILVLLTVAGIDPLPVILAWGGTVIGWIFGQAAPAIINFLGLPDIVLFGANIGPPIIEGISAATNKVIGVIAGLVLIAGVALRKGGRI
jgi:hypothetical protein